MFDDQNRMLSLEVVVFVTISEVIQCCIILGIWWNYQVIGSLVPNSGGEAKELPRGVLGIVGAQLVPNR